MTTQLRMKKEFIEFVKNGTKRATTRLKQKKNGEYELVSGSYYKPIKSGIIVRIHSYHAWKLNELSNHDKEVYAKDEGFSSFKEFWDVLKEINKDKLTEDTLVYTHWFEVVK